MVERVSFMVNLYQTNALRPGGLFCEKCNSNWWINYFKDIRDTGIFNDSNPLHVECLRFCYFNIIQEELNKVANQWNLHRIRPSNNAELPSGRPDVLYFLPRRQSPRSYEYEIDVDDLDIAEGGYSEERPTWGCHEAFAELALMIMENHGLTMPTTPNDAYYLFLRLLAEIIHI